MASCSPGAGALSGPDSPAVGGGGAAAGTGAAPAGGGSAGAGAAPNAAAGLGGAAATGGALGAGGVSAMGGDVAGGAGGSTSAGQAAAGDGAVGGTAGTASAGGGGSAGGGALGPVTLFLAGDSTVSNYTDTASTKDQAGWGQMLPGYLKSLATVDNRAVGGRTSRRFIEEGYLDQILSKLRAGDYLFVQFGTNDSNKTATYELEGKTIPYYLEPQTDFKAYLQEYIDEARSRRASPVLVTPPPRNSAYCTGGNGTGAYAQAMRELGQANQVPVLDLNRRAVDYLKAICPSPTPEDFFLVKPDGTVDGTHFQENGARILAGFVAAELRDQALPLAAYLK